MATTLTPGKHVTRAAPSRCHDARKSGALVVTLTGISNGAVLELRPKGRRKSVSVMLDSVYDFAVKLEADAIRRERLAAKRAKKTASKR